MLAGRPEVAFSYLFGSRARGEAGAGSDLDAAVWVRDPGGADLAGIKLELLDLICDGLGLDWVDVLILNAAPASLRYAVQREGRLILDRDPPGRIAFECRARKDYWDLEPRMKAYAGAMLERLKRGTFGA